jgi:tetratricopeptide (TPR) repeat protein
MADEGAIEGLFGAEQHGEAAGHAAAPADGVAVSVALDQARAGEDAAAFLRAQKRLVDLQVRHFEEEHRLAIAAAKRKRYADHLRNALWTFIALVLTGLVLAVLALLWDARRDHGLVVEAFSVPPDFAARGITGRVIAGQVLDRVAELDRKTDSIRAASTYANNWGGDIKVEIPEIGVSVGEVIRLLHQKLGRETRVEGEVYRNASGVTVGLRVGDEMSVEKPGAEADLADLVRDAATEAFAHTQPYRYGVWLAFQNRTDEAIATFRALADDPRVSEAIWGLHGLALTERTLAKRMQYVDAEQRLDPSFAPGCITRASYFYFSGQSEAIANLADTCRRLLSRKLDARLSPASIPRMRALLEATDAYARGDYQAMARWSGDQSQVERGETQARIRMSQAIGLARDHDLDRAAEALALGLAGSPNLQLMFQGFEAPLVLDEERGDWAGVVERAQTLRRQYAGTGLGETFPAVLDPIEAVAYAHLGRFAEADALFAGAASGTYDRWIASGKVAMLRKDSAGAEKAFSQAAALGPSLGRAQYWLGNLRAAQGDWNGAIAQYAQANRRSPHFADPLKAWGDALDHLGHREAALAKYDEALRFAPEWKELKQARDRAARTGA